MNSPHRKTQQLKYKHRVRSERHTQVLEYLKDNPCVICKETDPVVLEFDHCFGGKIKSISNMVNDCNSWETILEEIKKCQVLCANCHRRKTYKQLGFWKYNHSPVV